MIIVYLFIPGQILHGSRGMATEGGNSNNIGSKRLAPPRLTEDLGYRSWKNKILMWKLVCGINKNR